MSLGSSWVAIPLSLGLWVIYINEWNYGHIHTGFCWSCNIPGKTKSIPGLLMTCLHALPSHQHPCYWLFRVNGSISSLGRDLSYLCHDDVIKWKHFPRYWPFVRGIHRFPVKSPHKGQWRGALMFSLICVWINGWVNNGEAGDLRCHRGHYDVTVMPSLFQEMLENANMFLCFLETLQIIKGYHPPGIIGVCVNHLNTS